MLLPLKWLTPKFRTRKKLLLTQKMLNHVKYIDPRKKILTHATHVKIMTHENVDPRNPRSPRKHLTHATQGPTQPRHPRNPRYHATHAIFSRLVAGYKLPFGDKICGSTFWQIFRWIIFAYDEAISILSRVIFAFAKSVLIISNVLFNRAERRTFYKITKTQIRGICS